jgi:hypothetical protein
MVVVTCVYTNVSETHLVISNQSGTVLDEHLLNTSPQSIKFNVSNYTPGTYIVTLFCAGVAVDNKIFAKE